MPKLTRAMEKALANLLYPYWLSAFSLGAREVTLDALCRRGLADKSIRRGGLEDYPVYRRKQDG